MTAPDPCPGLMPITDDTFQIAKNIADILVPSGRDRPRPEQQVVSLSEYNELMDEFEHMKGTANKALDECEYIAADRDAAYNTIGRLRREYNIPLSPEELKKIIDTDRDTILAERNIAK